MKTRIGLLLLLVVVGVRAEGIREGLKRRMSLRIAEKAIIEYGDQSNSVGKAQGEFLSYAETLLELHEILFTCMGQDNAYAAAEKCFDHMSHELLEALKNAEPENRKILLQSLGHLEEDLKEIKKIT